MERNSFGRLDINQELIKRNLNGKTRDIIYNDTNPQFYNFYFKDANLTPYFFKKCNNLDATKEVLISTILNNLGINTCLYDYATYKEYNGSVANGVCTKSFAIQNFKSGSKIFKNYFNNIRETYTYTAQNLETIWDTLNYYYPQQEVAILMTQVVDLYLISILFANYDMHEENWGIIDNRESVNLAPFYDFSLSLYPSNKPSFTVGDSNDITFTKSLRKFLKISDQIYIERFKYLLFTVTPIYLENTLKNILKAKNFNLSKTYYQEIITSYKINYRNLLVTLEEYERGEKNGYKLYHHKRFK